MPLNPSDIAVLADEVALEAAGGTVRKVRDGREGEVRLELRRPGRNVTVLLAAGTPEARLVVASVDGVRQPEPTPFCQLLRKHLTGARLLAVGAYEGDRVVELVFEGRDGEGRTTHWRLIGELSGRHGNLFLVDERAGAPADGAPHGGAIAGSMRPNVSRRRALVAGEAYEPPAPPPAGLAEEPARLRLGSASGRVEAEVEAALAEREARAAQSALRRDLRKRRKRLARRLAQVERDAQRAAGAERLRRWGQLLQSAWGQVEAGAESARVPDYFDPEQRPVDVPLDPSRSLASNVERYFKEAKRLEAARSFIDARHRATAAELAEVEAAEARVPDEADADALQRLRAELIEAGTLPPTRRRGARRGPRPERSLPYWTFTSRTGGTILVGKSARANDELTLKVARGRDLWLHVDGAAGSHVVIRLDRGAEPDSETLLDAALLAMHYSKRRGDTGVDVRFTRRKHINKPKGAPAGLVTLAGARSIFVKRDPQRLERLFRTRDGAA